MPVDSSSLHLPTQPGVYLFKTTDGRVLYIGKATHLKDRVRSYFAKNPDRAMIPTLIAKADLVDCIVTGTPSEALILERQLIREHKPRYNSLLKDDKSYPFIAITSEEVPRVMYTRHPPEGARLWGPFADAGAAKRVIQLLRRHFGIRDCKELLPQGCLSMHIGLCAGPCIEVGDYDDRVRAAMRVLDGDGEELVVRLKEEMDEHSENLRYEVAARNRDLIAAVRKTLSQQVIHSRFYQECDAVGFANQGDLGTIVLLSAENGIVVGQSQYPLMHRGDISESVSRVLSEHYAERRPPKTVLIPAPIGEWMESWLTERRGSNVEVRNPQRGELAKLRKMADANAEAQVMRYQRKESGSLEQRAADEGATLLRVERLDHVVCFDMAQLQGDERVGASICLRNGRPDKKAYRTYTVKDSSMDDARMMRHVVERWLKRQEDWPDLLLIDGGVVHLNEIHNLLLEHGLLDRVPLATLAKREETIHRIDHDDLVLDRQGRVLVFARDEAHRFVNNFHRKRRGKKGLSDPLEAVEGLGAKRLQALLRHFGGRRGIDHASQEDLTSVEGIGPALAERIWREIH
ncbi:MAG: excinuclease ABC subunit UvrC [Candidatus Thalassarchaeaceae archaeon]|nr:excinuclease ABC subunit UvrC [Candidatus Thalassarchaeaceae archaeon]